MNYQDGKQQVAIDLFRRFELPQNIEPFTALSMAEVLIQLGSEVTGLRNSQNFVITRANDRLSEIEYEHAKLLNQLKGCQEKLDIAHKSLQEIEKKHLDSIQQKAELINRMNANSDAMKQKIVECSLQQLEITNLKHKLKNAKFVKKRRT